MPLTSFPRTFTVVLLASKLGSKSDNCLSKKVSRSELDLRIITETALLFFGVVAYISTKASPLSNTSFTESISDLSESLNPN